MIKKNLRNGWILKNGISTVMESAIPFNGELTEVSVPHDAMIGRSRHADALSGAGEAYFEHEDIEYSLKFFVSDEEREKVHYLNFDGIYMNATVLVNGVYVTRHTSGYNPFTEKIDEFLKFGEENVLRVQLRDQAAPFARWYAGNGIYREANMLVGNPIHIEHDGIYLSTISCDSDLAVLNAEIRVQNEMCSGKEVYARLIIEKDNNTVKEIKTRCYISGNDTILIRKRIELDNPMLWDYDTPSMYTCKCELMEKETKEVVDTEETTFGIRILQLDSCHGMRINGKSIKLKGGCLHHDNGVIGSISVPDIEIRKIQKLKEAGYNAVRTAHNVPSKAFLDACDQVGMYVMLELTDCWTEPKGIHDPGNYMPATWEKDIEDAVKRDFNHPSVVMWSIGNEIPEIGNPVSNKWGRKFVDKIKELDSTRFVTNGINVMMACFPNMDKLLPVILHDMEKEDLKGGINDLMNDIAGTMQLFSSHPITMELTEEACEMLDLVGYNYSAERYEKEHELYPERVFFGSETPPSALDVNWELVKKHPYVIGDFAWTAWDYIGEVGIGRAVLEEEQETFMGQYPWITAYCADFDISGYRKPQSYWREIVWGGRNHKPYIAVQSPKYYGKKLFMGMFNWTDSYRSWSWEGYEGTNTTIEVYSDAEEIELFVNGKSLGKKAVDDEFRHFYCKWDVEYEPGEIKAVAYMNGETVGEDILQTVTDSKMVVRSSKTELRAGSDDLCIVEMELRDVNGTLDLFADRKVTINVEGPVELWGSGSADPQTTENYKDFEHKFFGGRMMAVLRAGNEAGDAKVKLSGNNEVHIISISVK